MASLVSKIRKQDLDRFWSNVDILQDFATDEVAAKYPFCSKEHIRRLIQGKYRLSNQAITMKVRL